MKKIFTFLCLCLMCIGSAFADGGKYVKVTSASDLVDGQYLIVYETGNVALNGMLTADAAQNTVAVTISNGEIASTATIDAAAVTYSAANGSFLGGGGKYIGHTGTSNTLNYSTTPLTNTVSFDGGNVVINGGSTYVLRFNKTSGQERFRYYKGTQELIQLYKYVAGTTPTTGPTISCADITGVSYEGVTDAVATPTFNNNEGWMATVACDRIIVTSATLNDDNTITYTVSKNSTTEVRDGSITITLKKYGEESIEKVVKVSQLAKPVAYASLTELVAADITSGTTVTVSFENVPIKSIFVTQKGYRNGIYFDIQKDDNDIELFYQDVPEDWIAGGTVSGTITCPWKVYNGTWELAPEKDTWDWNELTYTESTAEKYAIEIDEEIENGTVEADAEEAAEDDVITLTVTPAENYVLGTLIVTTVSGAPVTVTGNKFIMPASDVTVSATFEKVEPVVPGATIFYESFDTNKGTGGNGGDDGNSGAWSGSIATSDILADNDGWNFVKANGANQCAKFGSGSAKGSAETPTITFNGDAVLTFKAGAWNGSSEKTTLLISATSGTLSETSITLKKGAWTEYTLNITNVTGEVKIKFEAANTSNNRFFLDEVKLQAATTSQPFDVEISAAGWATACIPFDATVSGDVTAYYVWVEDGKLVKSPVTGTIPAETGILLKSNNGGTATATFTEATLNENELQDEWADNQMIGTVEEGGEDFEENGYTYYILANGSNGIGFYWDGDNYPELEGMGAHCAQYKAVLAVPGSVSVKGFSFADFDGDVDAINSINADKKQNDGAIYNLNGQRLNSLQKGLNIVNGKKVYIR